MSPSSTEALIDQALVHHAAGRFAQAETIYRNILAGEPNHPPALHLLGVLQGQTGNKQAAVELIRRAIAANANVPEFHSNLALALIEAGRPDAAVAAAGRAIQLKQDFVDAHNHLGHALYQLGRFDEAIAALQEALRLRPGFIDALHNLALALADHGRVSEAIESAKVVAALRGGADDEHIRIHIARALSKNENVDQAIAHLEKAAAANPDSAEAHCELGAMYQKANRVDDAMACYHKALAIDPQHAYAHNNLGYAFSTLGRTDEAIEHYRRALLIRPDTPDVLNNLANAHRDRLEIAEAEAAYRKALLFQPDYFDAHWNLSLLWLLKGEYEKGWHEYEWRWVRFVKERRTLGPPRWDGSDIAGKTILLYGEQGRGDEIQFARYAPLVADRGATVIVECRPDIVPLLRRLRGVSGGFARGEAPPTFDLHCPLMSLPLLFGTTVESIPSTPYLTADEELTRQWRDRIGDVRGPKIGVAWAGSKTHPRDRERSLPAAKWPAAMRELANLRWFSLQKEPRDEPPMPLVDHTAELRDFAQTAALIANLDLVISVDTAVAHLAGAMGKPVWILLPFNPDWRWLLERTDSPWYPTARLLRQPAPGDWDTVMSQLARELPTQARSLSSSS